MDHAKMEEVARMLWMILTAAVSLDTRGRIVVLVSYFQDFTKANSEQFLFSEEEFSCKNIIPL